jgi:hypothetical protein
LTCRSLVNLNPALNAEARAGFRGMCVVAGDASGFFETQWQARYTPQEGKRPRDATRACSIAAVA